MSTLTHHRLLLMMDSKQLEVNYASYEERTLCIAIGGAFAFISITILVSSLYNWCRSQNNIDQSTNNASLEQQQQQRQEPTHCDNHALSAIPVIIFGTPSSSSLFEYDNVCSICLAEFEDGENLRVLPCKHVFHKVCIDQWIPSRSLHCPICRDRTIQRGVQPATRTSCNNASELLILNFVSNPHISHL